nr:glycine cleavage system aminomethyltransferase GcvT [bacterium]
MPQSPLHHYHQELGARFVDFGGWEMPLSYGSALTEHRAVREGTGWFDVSHLGRFSWSGEGWDPALSRLLCNDHGRIGPGRAQYTMILNSRGGVIDDLIIWKRTPDEVTVMPNGVNHLRVMEAFGAAEPRADLSDLRPVTVSLAVQGPEAPSRVEALLGSVPGPFRVMKAAYRGEEVWVAGTGYTGERGVELIADPETGEALARDLTASGATPCGLASRDLLRLEAGLMLWGHDLNDDITPLEAGLDWTVRFNRDFVGREALERSRKEGLRRRLVAFRMGDRRIPREGYALRAGQSSGAVTSGNFSPMLGVGIGMGYLSTPFDAASLEVEIRGRWVPTEVVEGAFYRRG